jgi:GNAT superfamily N-acetyltransferase
MLQATPPKITLTDTPDARAYDALVEKLVRFNEAKARPGNFRPLAVLLEHPDTHEILGGLWGETYFSYLHIEIFYLPDSLRGSGLGRQLMEQAEAEAIQRGCRAAWLDTFSFQARGFYERLGYEVFGTLEDYPPGHSRFFLRKSLLNQKE